MCMCQACRDAVRLTAAVGFHTRNKYCLCEITPSHNFRGELYALRCSSIAPASWRDTVIPRSVTMLLARLPSHAYTVQSTCRIPSRATILISVLSLTKRAPLLCTRHDYPAHHRRRPVVDTQLGSPCILKDCRNVESCKRKPVSEEAVINCHVRQFQLVSYGITCVQHTNT